LVKDYITENRFNAVISKQGTNTEGDRGRYTGKLIGMYAQDVSKDFFKDHDGYDEKTEKLINKRIPGMVRESVIVWLDAIHLT